jgi:hypothetical protein
MPTDALVKPVYDAQAQAFNVTTITKKFYDQYRRHYERACAVIRQYNKGIREFQNSDETDKLHAFTQRLLGRLMFLYFFQRKGWLGGRAKIPDRTISCRTTRPHMAKQPPMPKRFTTIPKC